VVHGELQALFTQRPPPRHWLSWQGFWQTPSTMDIGTFLVARAGPEADADHRCEKQHAVEQSETFLAGSP
jgi:hypothetical protein